MLPRTIEPDEGMVLYNVACVYALVGEVHKALDCLEKSATSGYGNKEWMQNDPDFDPLRNHRRFQALLERLEVDRRADI